MSKSLFYVLIACLLVACSDHNDSSNEGANDITNAVFTNRSSNCVDYANSFSSSVRDVKNNSDFNGQLTISVSNDQCSFQTNQIPNHDFNDGASAFANDVAAIDDTFVISATPEMAGSSTPLSLSYDNAIFINGAKLDLLAAACFNVGNGKIGCGDDKPADKYWRYDPMHSGNNFGTDSHNAHAQPDGSYHYHGDPKSMYNTTSTTTESPLIGFAADGFPIFGPYFNDNGSGRKARSCYVKKNSGGPRAKLSTEPDADFPGGTYDGTYIQDYEYSAANHSGGTCDLDECNGMTLNGVYGYYVTDAYPWVLKCFKGTPHDSFKK